jgi:hypothetical protein
MPTVVTPSPIGVASAALSKAISAMKAKKAAATMPASSQPNRVRRATSRR